MDPRLNDQEKELQERARRAAAPLQAAAADVDAAGATPRALLAALADAGLLGVQVAASHGGGGGGAVEAALVCEQLGAASAGVAAVVAAHLMAVSLVAATAGEDEKDELLPALATGDKLAAVVLDGSVSLLDEPAVTVRTGSDGLSGAAGWVAGARTADLLVVPAADDRSIAVLMVEAGSDGLELEPGGRKLGLNGANEARVTLTGAGGRRRAARDAGPALAAARDLARIAHAALCVGIGAAALQAAAHHARSNEVLKGSQSVQWMLADIATETEAARLMTWYAASRRSAAELREAAAMARLLAADAAVGAARRAVQVMGPAGNESGSGVERLYRDAKAMEVHHGAAEAQRVAVARALLPDLFEDAARR